MRILKYCGSMVLAAGVWVAGAAQGAGLFDVTKYGAVGDGKTLETAAIQKAIDECAKQGGGTVTLPAGKFVSGTLILKDNVTLHLDEKAELLGSLNIDDYRVLDTFQTGNGATLGYVFIGAMDARNVGLEGAGTINGRGAELKAATGARFGSHRPFLGRFVRCTGVAIQGVHLQGPGAWTMPFFQCKQVKAERVTLTEAKLANNDGFDIDSCQGVEIKDCDIDSHDDSVCIKATSPLPSKDIVITGCRLKSACGAIKFGTESLGDFENVAISNCQILGANLGGLKLLSVDGAHLRNVSISDITMENVRLALFVRLGARLKTFHPGEQKEPVGTVTNVVVRNIRAKATSLGILISGIPGHPVQGLTLEDIELSVAGGGRADAARTVLPEKENAYPEVTMFGATLPAYGVYARHVNGLIIRNLTLNSSSPDLRPALICQDASQVTCSHWQLAGNPAAESLLRLESATNTSLAWVIPTGQIGTYLTVEGKQSGQITITGSGSLHNVGKVYSLGEGVAPGAVRVDQAF
jgi:hypothetical protein